MINLKKLLLIAIVVVVLYLVYTHVFLDSTSNTLYSGGNAKNAKVIPASKVPGNKKTVDFTYSIWIYIKDWQYRYGEEKVVFARQKTGEQSHYTKVSLAASTNTLNVSMATGDGLCGSGGTNCHSIGIENIPLQRWVHIMVSTNNRAVDAYIDGKLVKTTVLPTVPYIEGQAEAPIKVCPKPDGGEKGGFEGEISKFRYIARTVNPREAYEIYREGPGGNWLTSAVNAYKLKLSFMKDEEEVSSVSI